MCIQNQSPRDRSLYIPIKHKHFQKFRYVYVKEGERHPQNFSSCVLEGHKVSQALKIKTIE